MNIQAKVIEIINEDGVACATGGNTAGMGGITPAQPSTNAGSTIGSDFSNGDGTVGSGDIGFPLGAYQKDPAGKKKKKGKKLFQLKQNWTNGMDKKSKVMDWKTFNNED